MAVVCGCILTIVQDTNDSAFPISLWRRIAAMLLITCAVTVCAGLDWFRQNLTIYATPRVRDRATTGIAGDDTLLFLGTPQATPYRYTHTDLGYSLTVPSYWDLAIARTPHSQHHAVVLRSPEYKAKTNGIIRQPEVGTEFIIYAEPPRRIAPSPRQELQFTYILGELGSLPLMRSINIDAEPGYSYYRFPGGTLLPFQAAIVSHQGLHYRVFYKTAITDLIHPLSDFKKHQADYERLLTSLDLP